MDHITSDPRDVAALADQIQANLSPALRTLVETAATLILDSQRRAARPIEYVDQKGSGLTQRQWRTRIGNGSLQAYRQGHKFMVRRDDLIACMEANPVRVLKTELVPVDEEGPLWDLGDGTQGR